MNWIKNHSTSLLITGIVLLVAAAAVTLIMSQLQPTTVLHLGNGVFDARIATTPTSRDKGLIGVASLGPQQALILAFPSDLAWPITMKDMKMTIDIVWLNKDKKVVYSVKNASPDDSANGIFTPIAPARYVVELPDGTIEDQRIQKGDTGVFDIKNEEVR